jgi:hypothetical protein
MPLYCTQVQSLIGDVLAVVVNHDVVMLVGPARVTGVVLSTWTSQHIQFSSGLNGSMTRARRASDYTWAPLYGPITPRFVPMPALRLLMRPHGHRLTSELQTITVLRKVFTRTGDRGWRCYPQGSIFRFCDEGAVGTGRRMCLFESATCTFGDNIHFSLKAIIHQVIDNVSLSRQCESKVTGVK